MPVERIPVTCPPLLCRPVAVAELVGDLTGRTSAEGTVAQFARFVFVGGLSSALYGLLYVALHGLGQQPANLVGFATSSMVANELHRRLTFRADERVSWFAAQWEGGALALAGMLATSLSLAALTAATGTDDVVVEVVLIATVTAVVGTLRFLALRWVFGARPTG